ncbi:hypothetical protein CJF42_03580 [Pseudoalteromonas sp. NBT06-2]|uniref:hypothetical protein n=1 Tax=Pseudoalteromonas sp. NBT06-2 TaxID=2025950 RepID=UPI000BA5B668|nr:hypothetical protein [Pseudoalteromonas sp. NBT06-2]PAJ75724.1 hypothetical protein CJF42_03580 [Pseudoalteromonas sp. NBT06-2]
MSRLLDRIATLNFNVVRVLHEHPLQARKYLNGGTVRVVITPTLQKIICTEEAEKSVIKALKAQFKGRISELDLCQLGFFHYKNLKLGWFIQPMLKSDESILSDDMFDTKGNIFWVVISTQRGLKRYHKNRIQLVNTKRKNYE